jgi:hypothetical protein
MPRSLRAYVAFLELVLARRNGPREPFRSSLDVLRSLTDDERERLDAGTLPRVARMREVGRALGIGTDLAKRRLTDFLRWRNGDDRDDEAGGSDPGAATPAR